MELVQARFVTDDVPGLAAFYARLVRAPAVLNDYYVEVQAGPASVGFCRRRFTEYPADLGGPPARRAARVVDGGRSFLAFGHVSGHPNPLHRRTR